MLLNLKLKSSPVPDNIPNVFLYRYAPPSVSALYTQCGELHVLSLSLKRAIALFIQIIARFHLPGHAAKLWSTLFETTWRIFWTSIIFLLYFSTASVKVFQQPPSLLILYIHSRPLAISRVKLTSFFWILAKHSTGFHIQAFYLN